MIAHYYQRPNYGSDWIVEFKTTQDRRWTTVGVYGTREAAEAAYNGLWR